MHPEDLDAPIADTLILLAGNPNCSVVSLTVTHPMTKLAASISRRSHQHAMTASLQGKHGPSSEKGSGWQGISAKRSKGRSEACFAGPLPLAASLETLRKCKANDSGKSPYLMINSCLPALKYLSKERYPAFQREPATSYMRSHRNSYGSSYTAAQANCSHTCDFCAKGPWLVRA